VIYIAALCDPDHCRAALHWNVTKIRI